MAAQSEVIAARDVSEACESVVAGTVRYSVVIDASTGRADGSTESVPVACIANRSDPACVVSAGSTLGR